MANEYIVKHSFKASLLGSRDQTRTFARHDHVWWVGDAADVRGSVVAFRADWEIYCADRIEFLRSIRSIAMVHVRFKATFKGDPLDPKKWDHKIIQLAKSCLEQQLTASAQIVPDEVAQITIDFTKENGKIQYSIKGPVEIADKIRAAMIEL